jgi:hypothetical protein
MTVSSLPGLIAQVDLRDDAHRGRIVEQIGRRSGRGPVSARGQ